MRPVSSVRSAVAGPSDIISCAGDSPENALARLLSPCGIRRISRTRDAFLRDSKSVYAIDSTIFMVIEEKLMAAQLEIHRAAQAYAELTLPSNCYAM